MVLGRPDSLSACERVVRPEDTPQGSEGVSEPQPFCLTHITPKDVFRAILSYGGTDSGCDT
jgi:hypothetical protein